MRNIRTTANLKKIIFGVGLSVSGLANASSEIFYTFEQPNYQLTGCVDVATVVELEQVARGIKITLANKNLGNCEIAVPENKRSFMTKKQSNRCGQVIYKGRGKAGKSSVAFYDNRATVCHHLGFGSELRETLESGEASFTYSSSIEAPQGEYVRKVGILQTVFGIGGESTGYEVDGVEVDFVQFGLLEVAHELIGMKVVVTGYLQQIGGVEVEVRNILTAERIEPQYDYHTL